MRLVRKDPYPEGFNDDYSGCYSEAAITLVQLFLSVELSHNGTTTRRESRPTSAQLKSILWNQESNIFSWKYILYWRRSMGGGLFIKTFQKCLAYIMLLSASKFFKMKPTEKLEFVCKTFGLNSEVGGTSSS